jgi:hypothetical protein
LALQVPEHHFFQELVSDVPVEWQLLLCWQIRAFGDPLF